MAITVHRAGKTLVKIDVSAALDTWQDLGYTRDGVDISEQPFYLDVHGDENGGDAGPPIDTQHLGEIHTVTCMLTKWDKTVENAIRNALRESSTPGTLPTPGQFMIQDSEYFKVGLAAADPMTETQDRTYQYCIVRQPKTLNKGTKHEVLLFVFEAWMPAGGGVIYSRTNL